MRKGLRKEGPHREELFARLGCVSRYLSAINRRFGRPLGADALEDLGQNVLLLVWERLPSFLGQASLETWVYRFCLFQMLNAARRENRLRDRSEALDATLEEQAVEMPVDRGLRDSELLALLRLLSAREAEVVRLRHFEDLEIAEIAELLQVSASSVKTFYYRAITKLREPLARVIEAEEGQA